MAADNPPLSAQSSSSDASSNEAGDAGILLGHNSTISDSVQRPTRDNSNGNTQTADGTQPSSSLSSHESPFRSLVRTLTPRRSNPRPILVKAGIKRSSDDEDGGENRDALKVTFELPRDSMDGSTTSDTGSQPVSTLKRWCQYPIVPTAGALSLIGGMSFGYDIGIISAILHALREHWMLSCQQEEVLVGCLIGGAIVVSFFGGPWIDKCGRRRSIIIACCMFLIGTGVGSIADSLDTLSAARFLQGFGMSMAAVAECIYVSEVAPKEKRGFMVGLNELGITIGFLLAYVCGFFLQGVKHSWRIMMAIGAIPVSIQIVGTYLFLPPSPREKMLQKYDKEAILILENLRGSRNEAMNEFVSIRHTLVADGTYRTVALFKSQDNMLYRLLIGFSLVALQQFSGQPNMLFYASVVFEQLGFASKWAALASLGLGVVKVSATAVALSITDKKGRRFFLITGCLVMAVSIAIVGLATVFHPPSVPRPCSPSSSALSSRTNETSLRPHSLLPSHAQLTFPSPFTPNTSTQTMVFQADSDQNISNISSDVTNSSHSSARIAQAVVCFLALLCYVVGYSIGFGPMTWLVLTELYPSGIKGRAMSFANILNWSSSLLVSLTFLNVMTVLTPGGTFLLYSAVNVFSALYIFLVVPETTGKSLEKLSYDLRTIRPKQRFDENVQRLCPFLKNRMNHPGSGHVYSRVNHDSLL
ncbi:hypothetical protein RvY_16782 [Ramazzottius varieornatus]|uniref:Major facilitator superfamily (MFS) profile domain-containing protein n=1 Tax=Ramazzottius varieornatus TaxID=947166 RepID=A0A1D1VZS2_RAMVA|nr:hypothetical protein RvY_16782 [Ramazzottius varieornatus]